MSKSLDIDLTAIYAALGRKIIIRSSEIIGTASSVFDTKNHQYQRVDDATFIHVMNFTAAQDYSLRLARMDLVCVQIMIAGSYSRSLGHRVDLVGASEVHITNFPQSFADTQSGARLRGILIAIDREYFIERYQLDVDRIETSYRPIFSSRLGINRTLMMRATGSIQIATEQILSCQFEEPLRGIYLSSKAVEILCDVVYQLHCYQPSRKTGVLSAEDKLGAIDMAAEIYKREFRNPPSIEQLALRVGVNRNILTNGFRDHYGTTPHAYLSSLRMAEAQKLLHNGSMSISQAARQVGYAGYASFSRAYQEYFGYPPSKTEIT